MRTADNDTPSEEPAATATEAEALKTIALSLSILVASRSKNPRLRSAAQLISARLTDR